MSAGNSYTDHHVDFVSSETGTSASEILHVLISISFMPFLASVLIPWIVPPTYSGEILGNKKLRWLVRAGIEYPIVIILPILFITVLAGSDAQDPNYAHISFCIPTIILIASLSLIVINHSITQPSWAGWKAEWNRIKGNRIPWLSPEIKSPRIPFITNYRAIVTYITVISILAVDFAIFPRRFAKTKTFGFSLMDVGTGSFVFANGIVSSEAKNLKSNLKKTLISSIPLFVLGFIRLVSLKGLEYHEVTEEYGIHWNFFFTLAFVKIFVGILFTFIRPTSSLPLAFAIAIIYDIFLTQTGFQTNYLLNPDTPRQANLINANREGLFSSIGYVSIYLGSVYCGQLIYKNIKIRETVQDWLVYCGQAGAQVLILWSFAYLSHNYGNPSCRRAGNLSYILWALATNYTILWFHLSLSLAQIIFQHLGLLHGPLIHHWLEHKEKNRSSNELIESIHREEERNERLKSRIEQDKKAEDALRLLEGKVEIIADKIKDKETSSKDLEDFAKLLELELASLGKACSQEEPEIDESQPEVRRNLVELPDLTSAPVTLEAVCYNGLLVFLLGNLLTGLVNSLVYSIYTPDHIALGILWIYATVIILVSLSLHWFKLQFKFW